MKISTDIDRCAPFTRAAAVDPVGTAGCYHSFFLVEMKLPWPSEILDAPVLAGARDLICRVAEQTGRGVRILGIVPPKGDGPFLPLVTHYRRERDAPFSGFTGIERRVEPGDEIDAMAAMLQGHGDEAADSVDIPEMLVCTHGSRDVCCGSDGMRLHRRMDVGSDDIRIRRVSHTGGHRFAPTGITFPDGRFWGNLDDEVLGSIIERTATPNELRRHVRGSAGFPSPIVQVAERELFARVGWDIQRGATSVVEQALEDDHGSVTLRHTGPELSLEVSVLVELARRYPRLDCRHGIDPAGRLFEEFRVKDVRWA